MNTSFGQLTITSKNDLDKDTFSIKPPANFAKKRADHWSLARYALRNGLIALGLPSSNLDVTSYHYLTNIEHIIVSLTHTQNWAASLIHQIAEVSGLGIDIELKTRPISKIALKYFQHTNDHLALYSELECWVAKEAAFKSLSTIETPPKLLQEISVNLATLSFEFNNIYGQLCFIAHPELIVVAAKTPYQKRTI